MILLFLFKLLILLSQVSAHKNLNDSGGFLRNLNSNNKIDYDLNYDYDRLSEIYFDGLETREYTTATESSIIPGYLEGKSKICLGRVGMDYVICLLKEYIHMKLTLLTFMKRIGISILVFVIIATFCWCTKGWCCCCLCCRICYPRLLIDEVKEYYVKNPPGIIYINNKKIQYKPTKHEIYLYKRLENTIKKL